MKWLSALVLFFVLGSLSAEAFIMRHPWNTGSSSNPATVTIVSGTAIPQAEDNAHPSVSRWAPSCLDATWGTGCNVSTQTCTAPTVGTPDQPCQPPLQLVVDPARSSGNGTTATIAYTSYAHYTFPTGPMIVSNATTSAWNTQTGRITTYANVVGAPCTVGDQCVTLGISPSLASAFNTSLPIYVGGMGGNQATFSGTTAFGFGWGTSGNQYQGPNGKWTPAAASVSSVSYDINSSFPTGIVGSLAALNPLGYNGNIIQPAQVTSSACGDLGDQNKCHVSFANTTACAASCVTAATQIVAAQFDDPVIAWDTGPIAPMAVEGTAAPHLVKKCVDAIHLSHSGTVANPIPMQYVAFALNGGPFVKATIPQLDPWGVGANPIGDKVNHTIVYCAQFDASALAADGVYEMRAIACPIAGPCSVLESQIAAEVTNGSTTLSDRSHGLSDTFRLAVTASQDPAFKVYNGALQAATISVTGATWKSAATCGLSTPCVTYTFTQPTTLPTIPVGTLVNVTGVVNNNSCSVTGGSDTGGAITYNYSGGCSFPVGSEINVTGVNISSAAITANPNCVYTAGTGDVAITLPSAQWGASPQTGIFYTIAGVTGTNAALVNTKQTLASSSGAGTVLHFTIATGQTVSCTGTPTLTPNSYTWNNNVTNIGNRVGPGTNNHYPVLATDGSTTVTQVGMSTAAWSSGGTITENWNNHCVVTASGVGTITCPIAANSASATYVSGGTIQVNQNVYTVVGGPGDNPSPFDPAYVAQGTLTGDTFNLVPFLSDTGNFQADNTGCHLAPCGIAATTNSTVWFARPDAGSHENVTDGYSRAAYYPNDGSMFGSTNFHGTMQEIDGYVDSWNTTAVTSGCVNTPHAVNDWNATGPAFAGSYCGTITQAINSMVWNGFSAISETISNDGNGCTVFTSSSNANAFIGQPVNFQGLDVGAAGDGSNGLFTNSEYYWIVDKPTSTQILLGTTPNGGCLKETAALVTQVKFVADLSFSNIYLKCNVSAGCSGDNTNPQTVPIQTAGLRDGYFSEAGYFSILNDTGNGTVAHSVDLVFGSAGSWGVSGGNIHSNVDRNWPTSDLTVTNLNTIGPIPGAPTGQYGAVTVTGGSLSGTCPGVSCTETLTYTISDTPGGGHFTTATFQNPTASAPGQGLVIQNQTNTGGAGNKDWDCGTTSSPCVVISSTSTSGGGISSGTVSFLNPTADGTWSSSGATPIVPVTLSIEVAAGTLQHSNSGACANGSGTAYPPDLGAKACIQMPTSTTSYGVTNEFGIQIGRTVLPWSNCFATITGSFSLNYAVPIGSTTIGTGGLNDVITLAASSLTNPMFAWNQCSGGFEFTNAQNTMNNVLNSNLAAWDDSVTIDGPNYSSAIASTQGTLVHNVAGPHYITNRINHNATGGVDNSSYVWGSSVQYNLGSCHDSAAVAFHVRCVATASVVPPGAPYYGYLSQQPPHVLHSYDTYAHYIAGTPEITCVGVPCVADAAHSDSGTASKFLVLSANGVPRFSSPSYEFYLMCNYYPSGLSGGGYGSMSQLLGPVDSIIWQDINASAVEFTGNVSGSCADGATGNASLTWFSINHADTNFWTINNINTPSEYSNFNGWTYDKDIVIDDQDTTGTGNAEGFLTKGAAGMNVAVNHTNMVAAGIVAPGWTGLKAWVFQNVLMSNYLIFNSGIYGADFYAPDIYTFSLTSQTHTPLSEIWQMNDTFTDGSLSNPTIGFPYSITLDPNHGGVESLSLSIWNAQSDFDTIGGGALNIGLWPSEAWQVNQITGAPITPGQPNSISLRSCPWYCETGDPGSGLY